MRAVCLSLLILFCGWTVSAYKRCTHAFRPQKCQITLPHNPDWEMNPHEIDLLCLQKPFTYLAKGQQSYVFLSADGNYVLKLFRFDTCKIPIGQNLYHRIQKWIDPTVRTELPAFQKAEKTFTSCKLAYEKVPDLTGLVYIHLNPDSQNLPILQLKDRLGRTHKIDPSQYRFILQKKCSPFLKTLHASENKEILTASFLRLLDRFAEEGLANYDPVLGRNFAFLGEQAIAIDIGNFYFNPEKAQETKNNFKERFSRISMMER